MIALYISFTMRQRLKKQTPRRVSDQETHQGRQAQVVGPQGRQAQQVGPMSHLIRHNACSKLNITK